MKPSWNAADYASHSSVQQAWARELISKLRLAGNEDVLDVGCGDGKVTAELARTVSTGSVIGIDASPAMIEFARSTFKIHNLEFRVMDARDIRFTGQFDVLFSNAALHWVDDQEAFLSGAQSALRSGGRLTVSCGGQRNAHHVFMAFRPEMRLERWRRFFRGMEMPYFMTISLLRIAAKAPTARFFS